MSEWIGAGLLVLGVLALCHLFRMVPRSRAVFQIVQVSFWTISDRALDEEVKERRLQQNALRLFRHFFILLLTGAVALALPLGALAVAARLGWLDWSALLALSMSLPFLGATLLVSLLAWAGWRYLRPPVAEPSDPSEAGFENRYTAADRWLHDLAFATTPLQVGLSRLEDRWNRGRLSTVRVERPVFITALPRAGTTLLLNLCAELDEFVTHTYRRMPFVLTPLAWERFSRSFRVEDAPRERAHADGLQVSADSPEALEEMLWLSFWDEHYQAKQIVPWEPGENHEEFREFFEQHMRKLAALELPTEGGTLRYLSKNNGNAARISWLLEAFPDARIVVPFRPPLQHAQSLLRQHRNFLSIHERDAFARRYMAGIGHFDFGANLRPIDFDHWLDQAGDSSPTELTFWLRYWTAGYKQMAALSSDRLCFVDFDELSRAPARELARLAEFLELQDPEELIESHRLIRRPPVHRSDMTAIAQPVLDAAAAVHSQLVGLGRRRAPLPSVAPLTLENRVRFGPASPSLPGSKPPRQT